ncbi:glycine betaine/carnitine/choline/choline sulfate ABC transporter (ATP-binding protein) [Brochothrix thermosphacta]|uniref:ABC transporter ATP-binding protein n=1 Tax=Brochothrix thermosphacta TaxID=2756 RepID=UPI000D776342|nr:ABC transporter ATP-binding protein [Brochothrix thermosphacta]SPN72067.1 glycine betaine/carnitine/choline/choline sulfate ABC transporter (ATP-binding protein) [Brochothrix thermosphacta]
MIKFKKVSKIYGDQTVIEDFSLTIAADEFFVLVGPSGSGKTTTLKMINRLIEPTDGDIYFKDKRIIDYDIQSLRLNIGYVLQQIALFPNLTVAENIELIPELKKWNKEKRRKRTIELLKKVKLDPDIYLHRKPDELSGGEQQRIGILRAIATEPDVILMDEPFSALDPISRNQLQLLIKELHQEINSMIVFVTHDMSEALLLGDRICIMNEGKIVQIDTPEKIKALPKNDFVAQFFKNETTQGSKWLEKGTVKLLQQKNLIEEESINTGRSVSLNTPLYDVLQLLIAHSSLQVIEDDLSLGYISEKSILRLIEEKEL